MKTKFFLALGVGILFSISEGFCQWLTVGNAAGPSDFLGTTNAQDLRFQTNGANRMRLMQTGALGLGAFNFVPSAHLHANLLSFTSTNGALLRTDGAQTQDLTWSMWSGTTVANSTQKARFFLSPNTITQNNNFGTGTTNLAINHLVAESTLGDVIFNAAGATEAGSPGVLTERLRITSDYITDVGWGANPVSATRIGIPGRQGVNIRTPLAMIHMGDEWWYELGGHRSWMNSGTYAQRLNDNVFFGIRPREGSGIASDQNDAIVAWGDNDTPANRLDALRFVFCGPFNAAAQAGTAPHLNGLEVMRMHPQGNIGMGDFSLNGLDATPTERLDVDGNIRARQVPLDANPDVLITGVQQDAVGDYSLSYLSFTGDNTLFLSGDGTWQQVNSGADMDWEHDANNVWTGHGLNGFPAGNVAVGLIGANAEAKMHVYQENENSNSGPVAVYAHSKAQSWPFSTALQLFPEGGYEVNQGSYTKISGDVLTNVNYGHKVDIIYFEALANYGLYADVTGAEVIPAGSSQLTRNIGVLGRAHSPANPYTTYYNMGVSGSACLARINYGVYGEIPCPDEATEYWAGFFDGPVFATDGYTASDASLKTNVNSIASANAIISQLNPVQYQFTDDNPLTASNGVHYGLIAQEVEAILPELVRTATKPARWDSLGNVISEELEFKSLRYNDFFAILLAASKEQSETIGLQLEQIQNQEQIIENLQSRLDTQAEQLEAIQQQMASMHTVVQAMQTKTQNCCSDGSTGEASPQKAAEGALRLEQNIPNPFDTHTRIDFTLPADARVVLELSDMNGRPLHRLIDGPMKEGAQTLVLDGSALAPGMYLYTVYANGEMISRKMVRK